MFDRTQESFEAEVKLLRELLPIVRAALLDSGREDIEREIEKRLRKADECES
jgi:hypothetical protein